MFIIAGCANKTSAPRTTSNKISNKTSNQATNKTTNKTTNKVTSGDKQTDITTKNTTNKTTTKIGTDTQNKTTIVTITKTQEIVDLNPHYYEELKTTKDGIIYVFGRNESLSGKQIFTLEAIQGLFARDDAKFYQYF